MAKDMYQKRKERQEKNNSDKENVLNKSVINWFPGHMAKTNKQIQEDLKLIDVVVELIDARIPISSRNPNLQEYTKNKKKIIVLNKSDLANEEQNKKWMEYYTKQGIPTVIVDSNSGKGIKDVIRKIEEAYEEQKEKLAQRGRTGRAIRVMVVGIPNVGKSSFINRITNKTSTQVGNKPGVTRQKQWVKVSNNIELLDTPGVLWPKFDNNKVALNLSYTGTIKDDILQITEVAYSLLKYLLENNRKQVLARYEIDEKIADEILSNTNQMENENIMEIMNMIGKNRGAIISGGKIDEEKTSKILLDDFRNTKIGKITLEKIQDN